MMSADSLSQMCSILTDKLLDTDAAEFLLSVHCALTHKNNLSLLHLKLRLIFNTIHTLVCRPSLVL